MATPTAVPNSLGPYRLREKLGEGSLATVYRGEDSRNGRDVALKVLRPAIEENPEAREQFRRAAWVAASLSHPGLCPVHEVTPFAGSLVVVMDYLEGPALSRELTPGTFWPVRRALTLVTELARTLTAIHAKGVLHKNLKPSNIHLRGEAPPVLVDVGLSLPADRQNPGPVGGALPEYLAPEQVPGGTGEVGPATDVYALGALLYRLVVGDPPFVGSPESVTTQILHTRPRPPSALRPGLPSALDALCLKALEKNPGERFVSMASFADALAVLPLDEASPAEQSADLVPPPVRKPRLKCPGCGKRLRVPPALEGKPLRCPRCQTSLNTGPAPDGVAVGVAEDLPFLEPEILPVAGPAAGPPLTRGELLLAGGALGALAALAFWGVVVVVLVLL